MVEAVLTGELTWVCGPEGQEACARTDLFPLTTPAAPTVVTWRRLQGGHAHSQWASEVAEWAPSHLSQSSARTWLISAVGRTQSHYSGSAHHHRRRHRQAGAGGGDHAQNSTINFSRCFNFLKAPRRSFAS